MTEKHLHAEANFTEKMVKFARQLELYLAHFPSCHKYTLTQQIRQSFIDVYCYAVEAQNRHHKKTAITNLDVRHQQLRMLVYLANELELFDCRGGKKDESGKGKSEGEHRYAVLSKDIDELGRMIGGWKGVIEERTKNHAGRDLAEADGA